MKINLFLSLLSVALTFVSCGTDDSPNPVPPVVVATKPSVSTTNSVSKIGLTTASVSGNIASEGSAPVESCGFVYGTDSTTLGTSSSHIIVTNTKGTITADLTGLALNTVYYVKAYASNKNGISYGVAVKFWTMLLPIKMIIFIIPLKLAPKLGWLKI